MQWFSLVEVTETISFWGMDCKILTFSTDEEKYRVFNVGTLTNNKKLNKVQDYHNELKNARTGAQVVAGQNYLSDWSVSSLSLIK